MIEQALKQKFEATLKQLPLAYEEMTVFGTIRLNVHITCKGYETARKWVSVLTKVLGGKVVMKETVWYAKQNKNTVLRPTTIKGYLIAAVSA